MKLALEQEYVSKTEGAADDDHRLLLDVYCADWISDEDKVNALVQLFRALNAYHIACGGSGLRVEDWEVFVPEQIPVEVI